MLPAKVIPINSSTTPDPLAAQGRQIVSQVGRDQELMRLRARVLGTAGYTVHSMTPNKAVSEVRRPGAPHVWVFCHTLEFYEVALLAVAIRDSRPGDKLLRLAGLVDIAQAPGLFDQLLEPVKGVDDLLRAVDDLAKASSLSP
jgi:hypothetical protein